MSTKPVETVHCARLREAGQDVMDGACCVVQASCSAAGGPRRPRGVACCVVLAIAGVFGQHFHDSPGQNGRGGGKGIGEEVVLRRSLLGRGNGAMVVRD